jgi:hypothetical protein
MEARKAYPGIYWIRVLKPSMRVLHRSPSSFRREVSFSALYKRFPVRSRSPCSLFLKSSVYSQSF